MSRISSRDPARLPAIGRLSRADLLWLANTSHGPGGHWHARVRGMEPDHDHLSTPEAAVDYLASHGVPVPPRMPDARALAELAAIRAATQRLAEPELDTPVSVVATRLARARYVLDTEGRLVSAEPGWSGFAEDLLIPLLSILPDRGRLSRCSNPACRLLFEDTSRNHGRRWCDTAGCGNRDRVRRARRRSRPAPLSA